MTIDRETLAKVLAASRRGITAKVNAHDLQQADDAIAWITNTYAVSTASSCDCLTLEELDELETVTSYTYGGGSVADLEIVSPRVHQLVHEPDGGLLDIIKLWKTTTKTHHPPADSE